MLTLDDNGEKKIIEYDVEIKDNIKESYGPANQVNIIPVNKETFFIDINNNNIEIFSFKNYNNNNKRSFSLDSSLIIIGVILLILIIICIFLFIKRKLNKNNELSSKIIDNTDFQPIE